MGRTERHRRRRRAGSDSEQATNQGTPCQTDEWLALRSWSKRHGLGKHKLTLAYFPATFRGMMATRDIAADEDIVEIPENLLVTASKVRFIGHLSEHQALTLWVCQQHQLQERSSWHAYIATLPRDFDSTPLSVLAGETATEKLAPSTDAGIWLWRHLPRSMQAIIADQYARLVEDWRCAKLASPDILLEWRVFVWAWLAVSTRCINLGRRENARKGLVGTADRVALAPFLDFLNHNETAQVTVRFDELKRKFVIRTHIAYRKGQEVFISYGPHDNRRMLVDYGFVLAANPYRFLELDSQVDDWVGAAKQTVAGRKQSTVSPADLDQMVELLRSHGLYGDYTVDDEPSYRLLSALRLLLPLADVGVSAKRMAAQWERWRRGEAEMDDARGRQWVEGACRRVLALAERMTAEICGGGGAGLDNFLLRCLQVVWAEIAGVAGGAVGN